MNTDFKGSERRENPRLMRDLPVRLTIEDDREGKTTPRSYSARITNMSAEGIAIEISVPPDERILNDRQQVAVEFTLPDTGQTLVIHSVAIWSTKISAPFTTEVIFRAGLKIGDIEPSDAGKIRDYITWASGEENG